MPYQPAFPYNRRSRLPFSPIRHAAQGGVAELLIGRVIEPLPDALYRVELDDGHRVLCHPAGKARLQAVRILPGDRVQVELSAADPGRGRILQRLA